MTPSPNLQVLVDTVKADTPSDEPLELLSTAASVVAELEDTADALLGYFVDQSRRRGHSWTEISAALGVTRQAAHKRFSVVATPTLERFTARARHAIEAATKASRDLRQPYVGTEHILLGLHVDPESVAAKILRAHKVTRKKIETRLLAVIPKGDAEVEDQPPYTPRGADVIIGAIHEALQLGHNYVGTEHILLALFRDPDSLAAKILDDLGLARQQALTDVVDALSRYSR